MLSGAACYWKRKRTGNELLSRTLECSIIAAEALHRRVRDGNGCYVLAKVTSPKRWTSAQADCRSGRFECVCTSRCIGDRLAGSQGTAVGVTPEGDQTGRRCCGHSPSPLSGMRCGILGGAIPLREWLETLCFCRGGPIGVREGPVRGETVVKPHG